MAQHNGFLVVDKRLADELSGREKLKALITARFGTLQAFAGEHGMWPIRLSKELSGDRRDPEIRAQMAAALDLPVAEVNLLLDEGDPQGATGTG